jgi:aryl-alcohol dehydrogenase
MAAILAAKSLDVQIIIAVDVVDSRLELAKAFGATHCINGKSPDVKEQISAITVGNMLNFVVEATGVKACLKTAYDCWVSTASMHKSEHLERELIRLSM